MKRIILILALGLMSFNFAFSQAERQINIGLIGISYEIPITNEISVSPLFNTNLGLDFMVVGAKGDYNFDDLIGIDSEWDLYAGINAGLRLWIVDRDDYNNGVNNGYIQTGLQVGGRWFWNETWGINLELNGGTGVGGLIGVTMKL